MINLKILAFAALMLSWISGCNPYISNGVSPLTENTDYDEPFRPQIHFSPPAHWMNDPNGMFYLDGVYHLFYQHNPTSSVWGPMHWGHATSKDLIHWENKPIALFPDESGTIFSGSAVVDWNNSSGLGTKDNPPIVAMFTYHDANLEKQGRQNFQTQAIAFSLDHGQTWTKYAHNPVIQNPGIRDFRDPKVMWDSVRNQWVMVLAQKDHVGFYRSDNLLDWELTSTFGKKEGSHAGVWECPELLRLKDPDSSIYKYVLLVSLVPGGPNGGSATQYFVGDFNGKSFTSDNKTESPVWLDYGTDNYAGVTFFTTPDAKEQRTIFIGWMSNWQYATKVPTEKWRSAMTLPRELALYQNDTQWRVRSRPVSELNKLSTSAIEFENVAANQQVNSPNAEQFQAIRYQFTLDLASDEKATLVLNNDNNDIVTMYLDKSLHQIALDRSSSGQVSFDPTFSNLQTAPLSTNWREISFDIVVDRSSIEVFINNGETLITALIFPSKLLTHITLEANTASMKQLKIIPLSSVW